MQRIKTDLDDSYTDFDYLLSKNNNIIPSLWYFCYSRTIEYRVT